MAATAQPAPGTIPCAGASPPAMTRCECAGISFEEVARRMRTEGLSVKDVCHSTSCGQTCTACLPDLVACLTGGHCVVSAPAPPLAPRE